MEKMKMMQLTATFIVALFLVMLEITYQEPCAPNF